MLRFLVCEPGKAGGTLCDSAEEAVAVGREWLNDTGIACNIVLTLPPSDPKFSELNGKRSDLLTRMVTE